MNYKQSKTFADLFCPIDQADTPHRAGRVLEQQGEGVRLELLCRKCGNQQVQELAELPAGYRVYQVRVVGEDNPVLPATMRPLPRLEVEVAVLARSAQEAHEVAGFTHQLVFSGHMVTYYVDGEEHWDERY